MASIYKKGRDKGKKHAPWYFDLNDYVDGKEVRRTVKGFTDKGRTEQLAAKRENEARLRKTGMIDPEQEELAKKKQTDIEIHLEDFKKSISRPDNTAKHVKTTMGRVRCVVDGCDLKTLSDISSDDVECCLEEMREEKGLGHRTYNHYVQAFEQFCSWLVAKKRLATNPVKGLTRLNCAPDVRRRRRALNLEEFGLLVRSACTSSEVIQRYDGQTRAKIYILSNMTGLRRQELASLMPRNFNLGGSPATVTLDAMHSKHRKPDVLPLHPDLILMLHEWLKGMPPDEFLFPKLAGRKTSLMVKKDLERVGIPYRDKQGRVADFHAIGRHTFITELLRNGATLPQARKLARHSDINMTMRYTHIGIKDQAEAIAKLPNSCQHIVSTPGDSGGPEQSRAVAKRQDEGVGQVDVTSDGTSSSVTDLQKKSPSDKDGDLWRRRDSIFKLHEC